MRLSILGWHLQEERVSPYHSTPYHSTTSNLRGQRFANRRDTQEAVQIPGGANYVQELEQTPVSVSGKQQLGKRHRKKQGKEGQTLRDIQKTLAEGYGPGLLHLEVKISPTSSTNYCRYCRYSP